MSGKIDSKKLEKQLKGKDMVLLLTSKEGYSEKVMSLAKLVSKQAKNICYITVNKPVKAIIKSLHDQGINAKKFQFIDCISRSTFGNDAVKGMQKETKAAFMGSPGDLTGISIAVDEAKENGAECFLVDALSTFVVYEKGLVVTKFAHNMMTKLRGYGSRGLFIVVKNDMASSLIDDLGMFVDGVIEI